MKRPKIPAYKTNNELMLGIRKPTAKAGAAFKDKSKYSRKGKHKRHED